MRRFAPFILAAVAALGLSTSGAGASVPGHIPTWAFDEKFAQGENASAGQVQRYVTYALGGLGNDKAVDDCGRSNRCFSVFYFDPALVYDSPACPYSGDKELLAVAREDWFVHLPGYSDKAHRAAGSYTQNCKGASIRVPVYEVNQSNPTVAAYYAAYLQRNADDWDYYEMDDTSADLDDQFYGPGGGFCKGAGTFTGHCTATQELADDRALRAAHASFASKLRHRDGRQMRLFYNGINFGPDGARTQLLREPAFVGAICEGCVVAGGVLKPNLYEKVLDAMARVDDIAHASFVELSTGSSPAGSDDQIAQRLVTTAVAWLGFRDGHTIVWPDLESSTHNLAVWPEDDVYPSQPVETMQRGARDLAISPSVWRREFRSCYRAGAPIGPCAAVVNGSGAPVSVAPQWFRERFSHALVLRGGDSLSGGSLDFTSAPASMTIAPGHAALLVR